MSNTKYILKEASLSDVGRVRQLNEDRELVVRIKPDCMAYIVCDGMGGHDSGDKASEAAVRFISEYLTTKPIDNTTIALVNAIKFANQQIYFESKVSPTSKGMGTTAVVMLQYQDEIHIGHVGDSRAYLFHNNKLTQITKDHSVVQDMVDQGLISQSQAEHHPRKNEITKALGIREMEEPSISKNIKAVKGDRIVLCSDGLSGLISHEVFTKTLQTIADPMACALQLIKLANQGGGHDNITVQVIDVLESPHKAIKEGGVNQNLMLSIAAGLVGILVVTFAFRNSIKELLTGPKTEISVKISNNVGGNSGLTPQGTDNSDKIDLDKYVTKETLIDLLKFTDNESNYLDKISKKQIDILKSSDINLLKNYKVDGGDTTYKLSDFFKGKLKKKINILNPHYFFSKSTNPDPVQPETGRNTSSTVRIVKIRQQESTKNRSTTPAAAATTPAVTTTAPTATPASTTATTTSAGTTAANQTATPSASPAPSPSTSTSTSSNEGGKKNTTIIVKKKNKKIKK